LPSDAQLKRTLLFEWDPPFNHNTVDGFIKEFRDTIAFAKLGQSDTVAPEVKPSESGAQTKPEVPAANPDGSGGGATVKPPTENRLAEKPGMNTYTCTLDSGDAILQFPKSISEEDLELMEIWMEMMKKKMKRSLSQPIQGAGRGDLNQTSN